MVTNAKRKTRIRQAPEVTRGLLLDATERLMVEEGYAAVTTRRVANAVGLTAALVHYYFPTTEDLLLAAYRRAADGKDEAIRRALESDRPLRTLWEHFTNFLYMALGAEFQALANHRKVIRTEIAERNNRSRKLQAEALARKLADAGVDPKLCPPLCAVMLLDGVSRALVQDEMLGISSAHEETKAFVEKLLNQLEGGPTRKQTPKKTVRRK